MRFTRRTYYKVRHRHLDMALAAQRAKNQEILDQEIDFLKRLGDRARREKQMWGGGTR